MVRLIVKVLENSLTYFIWIDVSRNTCKGTRIIVANSNLCKFHLICIQNKKYTSQNDAYVLQPNSNICRIQSNKHNAAKNFKELSSDLVQS